METNLLSIEYIEKAELEIFNFIQQHCIYRAKVKYGDERLWTQSNCQEPQKANLWQFYMMRALLNPRIAMLIGQLFWENAWPAWQEQPFQVAGVESSGIPLVSAIGFAGQAFKNTCEIKEHCSAFDCGGFTIRKQRKVGGIRNWTEGIINPELPVLVVDDLTNSMNQMARAMTVITELGLEIHPYTFSVIRFNNNDQYLALPEDKTLHLFRRDDFSLYHGERWAEGTYDRSEYLEFDWPGMPLRDDLMKPEE